MFSRLFRTTNDLMLTILRLVLGIVFFAHGAQKMLGWFNGRGFSLTMHVFTTTYRIPTVLAFIAICAEFFGALGLIAGLLTRIAAFGIMVNMVVAIFLVNLRFGFFMNFSGTQRGEGIEYHLLAMAICMTLVVNGSGPVSLDSIFSGPRKKECV
jgi:putative oxidoreductase